VLGGADGTANVQAKQLANRTAYLKQAVEDLAADLDAPGGAELVGYQPAGTGAVARTVRDKLREVVSIKDFGAVGDGVADDNDSHYQTQ